MTDGPIGVARQIDKIRECFLRAQEISSTEQDISKLTAILEESDAEFISVAYEAASMALALKDISQNTKLSQWHSFMEGPGLKHAAQVHVGLGWALAQQQLFTSGYIPLLDPLMDQRVLDGYGYYDGFFRSRKSIINHLRSEQIEVKDFQAYDIGIGRSLWYRSLGESEKIYKLVTTFSSERRANLWLGIGIASSYVGGFSETLLTEIAALANEHRSQLAIGTALAARARAQANSPSSYIEIACRFWCNCTMLEATAVTKRAEPMISSNQDNMFKTWLSQIQSELRLL